MSKRFVGKPCVYCLTNPSTRTGDHVFAREFFLPDQRDNLPKVPACTQCNNAKSALEHYLTAILPFGGRHAAAAASLGMVPARLAKNLRLQRAIAGGTSNIWSEERSGILMPTMAVPFDSDRLHELFRFIIKGLMWHHWGVTMPAAEYDVKVLSLTRAGEEFFALLSSMRSKKTVREDIGDGTFVYRGMQGVDCPEFSLWECIAYGGARLTGDPAAPNEGASRIGAITARRSFLESKAARGIFG